MQQFAQKWTLVSLLTPLPEGTEFNWSEWQPHVTLAAVFAVDWKNDNLMQKLADVLAQQKPIITMAEKELHWGTDGHIHVVVLKKTPELMSLHKRIQELLESHGAEYNEPQYEGNAYIPHSTVQKNGRINIGDTITLRELSIIDMFPGSNGYQRKIIKTFPFAG